MDKPVPLPPTSDKEFWGDDAVTQTVDLDLLSQQSLSKIGNCVLRLKGNDFYCTSCPFEHSVPLSTNEYTLSATGQLTKLDNSFDK